MRRFPFYLTLAVVVAACSSDAAGMPGAGSSLVTHGKITARTATTFFVDGSNGSTDPDACGASGSFTLTPGTQVLIGVLHGDASQLAIGQTVDVYASGVVIVTCPVQAAAGTVVIN